MYILFDYLFIYLFIFKKVQLLEGILFIYLFYQQ